MASASYLRSCSISLAIAFISFPLAAQSDAWVAYFPDLYIYLMWLPTSPSIYILKWFLFPYGGRLANESAHGPILFHKRTSRELWKSNFRRLLYSLLSQISQGCIWITHLKKKSEKKTWKIVVAMKSHKSWKTAKIPEKN